ncbi:MAG: peptide deformylase [Alphaproteobacteria bacterium]
MALLPILQLPDPRLRQPALPVARVDSEVVRLMDDMLETMYKAPGIGLAAPQVGVLSRIIVVDVTDTEAGEPRSPLRMVNPEIIWTSGEVQVCSEGCLSLPEQYADVERKAHIRVRYLDEHDETREIEVKGMLATVVQHEMDHLDGVLFVDHLSKVKRDIVLRKLQKSRKSKLWPRD